jgi:hypothetical protein
MICRVCKASATVQCPMCHRYACNTHTAFDPGRYDVLVPMHGGETCYRYRPGATYVCSECAAGWRRQNTELEERVAKEVRTANWCDFCGAAGELKTPPCAVRKKRFCKMHGQVVRYPEDSSHHEGWYRCQHHLRVRGILGESRLRTTLFHGKPDGYIPRDSFDTNRFSWRLQK